MSDSMAMLIHRAICETSPSECEEFEGNCIRAAHVAEAFRGQAIREACAVGWDAAVAAMVYEDGTPVEVAANSNPYRAADD